MSQSLVLIVLLVAIVALVVLRVLLRVRQVRRMRTKPRPNHLNPAVPILFAVLLIGIVALQFGQATPVTRPTLLGAGAATLIVVLAGSYFTNRDLRSRAGDSWDTRRVTVDGALGFAFYLAAALGVVLLPHLGGHAGPVPWVSPVISLLLLLLGNLIAWAWRRTHPDRHLPDRAAAGGDRP